MLIATIFGIAVSVCVILASTTYGWDKHIYDLTMAQLSQGRQISMAIQAVFIISSSCAKVSILVPYLALAPLDSWFRRLTKYAIVFIDILRSDDDCIPEGFPLMTQAILTAVADFIAWVLPLPTFYKAQIPIHQRVILIVLFSFGLFVVFAACIRTYWIYYVSLFRFWKGNSSKKGSSAGKSWSGSRGGAGGVVGGSKILTTSRVEVGVRKCVNFRSERSEEPLSPSGGNNTMVTVDCGGEEMELQEKRMNAFSSRDGGWGFEFDGARGMYSKSLSGGSTFGNRVEIRPGR
ncbi:hypothetical protein QBC32DRAFT_371632 [Pseudoneurospora amorphoporcata]|uniref:Rhodopsin domain-containing protein n=1 Tax=Pseudoneurospora amorphoporcata TaxID=241081 RepID=A0AAN6SE29_9PEZI|nr:hypothetical protein QBC32DRAFT_371632 [Pseudoneurospora amorphoporcata]